MTRGHKGSGGQATVEFALLLPVALVAVLAVGQVGFIVRDRVMLTHAAREGVRVAAVGGSDAQVRASVARSGSLDPARLVVSVQHDTRRVVVLVRYSAPTEVPLVGALINDAVMTATATMRREQPP